MGKGDVSGDARSDRATEGIIDIAEFFRGLADGGFHALVDRGELAVIGAKLVLDDVAGGIQGVGGIVDLPRLGFRVEKEILVGGLPGIGVADVVRGARGDLEIAVRVEAGLAGSAGDLLPVQGAGIDGDVAVEDVDVVIGSDGNKILEPIDGFRGVALATGKRRGRGHPEDGDDPFVPVFHSCAFLLSPPPISKLVPTLKSTAETTKTKKLTTAPYALCT